MVKKIFFRKSELKTQSASIGDRNVKAKIRIDWKKLREMRNWPKDKKDEFFSNKAQEARAKWMERWLKYFPDPKQIDGIDHKNPYLEVEWAMCDFRFLWKVCRKNKNVVQEALNTLSPEARQVYLYGTGPGNSSSYYEVSLNGSLFKALKDSLGLRGKQTDADIDDALNELYGDDEDAGADNEGEVKE